MKCNICGEDIKDYTLAYYSTYKTIFLVCRWCYEKLPEVEISAYEQRFADLVTKKATIIIEEAD